MPRSFLTSRIVTVPRESATMPSFSNDFKVRETTSLALPRFRAICSCVVESTGEPVRMRSSSRYPARRWSSRVKRSWYHRPHDFGKMLRCFPVNVVFNVNILIHQSAERAGRSDENFRLLLGLNQNIKADFLHRTGGRQRADFAGTGGKQGNFRCSPDWIKMRSLPERTSRTPRQSSSQL